MTACLNFTSPFFSARNAFKLVKKLIIYIPLFLGLIFIVHSILGFFGFTNPYVIDLGREIEIARYHLYDAPWASLWPGFFLFLLILGFILLYEGFQKSGVKSKR